MKIAIVGAAGRMGRMLVKLAGEDKDLEVIAEIDVADGFAREWPEGTEAVIDFSFHTAVPPSVAKAAEQEIPYVIGTTGLTPEEQATVDAAAKSIPVIQSGNYSLGVNLLLNLVKTAAQVLRITKTIVEEPKVEEPKKEEAKKGRKPFDMGKLKALVDGGWAVPKIADEMGVSEQTIRNRMKQLEE